MNIKIQKKKSYKIKITSLHNLIEDCIYAILKQTTEKTHVIKRNIASKSDASFIFIPMLTE